MEEWVSAIESFWSNGSDEAPSYGNQQQESELFTMREYRAEFGNGERVTDFESYRSNPLLEVCNCCWHLFIDGESADTISLLILTRIRHSRFSLNRKMSSTVRRRCYIDFPGPAAVPKTNSTTSTEKGTAIW